jgi:hypothetical protein
MALLSKEKLEELTQMMFNEEVSPKDLMRAVTKVLPDLLATARLGVFFKWRYPEIIVVLKRAEDLDRKKGEWSVLLDYLQREVPKMMKEIEEA